MSEMAAAKAVQERVVAAMLDPEFYPHQPGSVELVQTHISFIFLAGDYVYKVKKPVDFGFLDFRTLESRRYFCLEELRLNRRLAPDYYLEVVAVVETPDGGLVSQGLGAGGSYEGGPAAGAAGAAPAAPLEYAVKMRRLPEERMLKHLLARGEVGPEAMDAIARKLARFHAGAETGGEIDEIGGLASIVENDEENFRQTAPYVGRTVSAGVHAFLSAYAGDFVRTRRSLLERRVAEHRVRDCHGDVHLEHICLVAGEVAIFDCIEFNKRFRYSDVASEIAFLVMDLDYNGYHEHARRFAAAYIEASGDEEIEALLNFYACYRACVRAKVVGFRLDDPAIPAADKQAARDSASRYFDLALRYAAAPERSLLLVTAGLMGTGKSVLARGLADLMGLVMIRTDVLRKELLGILPEEHHFEEFGEGIYSPEMTERTYFEALARAREVLAGGGSAVIDASFKSAQERLAAEALADEMGAQFVLLECVCPDEVVRARLERRMSAEGEASDGRLELLESQKHSFEPVEELASGRHVVVDCSFEPETVVLDALTKVRLGDGAGLS